MHRGEDALGNPSSDPVPTVFVVFGAAVWPDGSPSGTLRRRTLGALIQAQGVSPRRFLLTGGQGRYGPPEAVVMRNLLLEAGVSAEEIVLEDQAGDTLDSVLYCARILRGEGGAGNRERVVVVSSAYHVPRCCLLFRLLGMQVEAGPITRDRRVLGLGSWLHAVLRETVATPWDAFLIGIRRGRSRVSRRSRMRPK
jgi:uncharacterized SAM-binding protein YcdF (DUF218 family)